MSDFDPIGLQPQMQSSEVQPTEASIDRRPGQTPAPQPELLGAHAGYDPGLSGHAMSSEELRYDLAGNPIPPVTGVASTSGAVLPYAAPSPMPGRPASPDGASTPGYGPPPQIRQVYAAQPTGYGQPPSPGYGLPAQSSPQDYAQSAAYGQSAGYGQPQAGYAQNGTGVPPLGPSAAYGPGAPPYAAPAFARQSGSGPNKAVIGAAISVGVVFVIAIAFLTAARRPAAIPVPSGFGAFTCPDLTFTCSGPADTNWNHSDSGTPGGQFGSETWTAGAAKIDIQDSEGASIMSDIKKIPDPRNPGEYYNPAEGQHIMGKSSVANKFGSYTETDLTDMASKYGTACWSEFTADGGMLVGKVHGIRATMMGTERSIGIVCVCPESSFNALKPAFWQVINSVAPGSEVQ